MKKRNYLIILALTFAASVFTSCNNQPKTDETQQDTITEENHENEKHEVHWSYEGETGPANWAKIIQDCSCGDSAQSPIDLSGTMDDKKYVALQTNYQTDSTLEIINNGHTIQVNYPYGTFKIGNDEYHLIQFHFHAGSEHTLNGKRFPLEAHMVHVSADNKIAVIGIWFEEGKENTLLKKLVTNLPQQANDTISEAMAINVKDLMPKKLSYYHYMGSLTTPPCTEGVNWFVMKTAQQASAEQINLLKKYMPENNFRPVQPLNGRTIEDF